MRVRLTLAALIAATGIIHTSAAGDEPTGDFARLEVRGTLGKETTRNLRPASAGLVLDAERQAVKVCPVTVERGGRVRTFYLDFPDEATRKAGTELVGQAVVVTGDLDFREGDDGSQRASKVVPFPIVTVKGIKRADPLPKK